jgi:hypothetical protein
VPATARQGEECARREIDVELGARIDQIERDFRALSIGELCRRADLVRQLARAHGREPLARLAGGLRDALAREQRGTAIRPWLDGMRGALGCEVGDEASTGVFLAAVAVRLGV